MAELAKIRALCTGANPNDTLVAEAAAAVQAKQFQEALDKLLQLPDDAPQKLEFQAQNIYCVCLWQVGRSVASRPTEERPRAQPTPSSPPSSKGCTNDRSSGS